jgi:zinc D-Ala-D-Ala carboxypeptidase
MYYGNIQKVMEQLEVLRRQLGSNSITINSGYRSPEHNENVGGKSSSAHLKGKAVDFTVKGYTPVQVRAALRQLIENGKILDGGIGQYNTFTHYDIGTPRTWKG